MLPPHLYYKNGVADGGDPSAVNRATAAVARLRAQGAYPVLSLAHLAHETGASYSYLREIVNRTRDAYTSVALPKQSGGTRPISVPEPILMDVQRWLLSNVLNRVPEHPASFAYRHGVSIVQCAEQHVGAQWMVKMDLHNFFGTVLESSVYPVFRRLGYSKLVAFELARITTRAEGNLRASGSEHVIGDYSMHSQGVLPQGGPTSGQLANAVAGRLDRLLQAYATRSGLVYTRYSDDLAFSGHSTFSRMEASGVIGDVNGLVRRAGFEAHRTKSRVVPPGARKIVLGLLVDDSVRLLPEDRRRIEVHLRGCQKFGLAKHAAHRGFDSVFSFIDHLDGWISFALGVERARATAWRQQLRQILTADGLPADLLRHAV